MSFEIVNVYILPLFCRFLFVTLLSITVNSEYTANLTTFLASFSTLLGGNVRVELATAPLILAESTDG